MNARISVLIGLFVLAVLPLHAENWPHWRGPNYDGSSQTANLPTIWSTTDNVKWVAPMPGESAATPIVWQDRVFVSSMDTPTNNLLSICLDSKSGKVLWQKKSGQGNGFRGRHNEASPSPVTDGERVYFYYGTGGLVCYDFDGNKIWERNIETDFGKFAVQFGYASSPLLYNNRLYIQVLQRNTPSESGQPLESYLLAIDPKTGKDLWKHVRPSDAMRESLEAYTTPIPFEGNGRKEIIIHGGDYTTGHDAATGKELWRWGNYNLNKITSWRIVPSAVTGGGNIYVSAPKRAPLYAVPGGATGRLNIDQAAWKFEAYPTDVCTPLFYNNRLYVFDGDRHVINCLDPKSGKIIWTGNLGGKTVFRSSPTGGDGKIYLMNENGLVVILDAGGDAFKEINRVEIMEGPCTSSIPLVDGCLFIRTAKNLYCVCNNSKNN